MSPWMSHIELAVSRHGGDPSQHKHMCTREVIAGSADPANRYGAQVSVRIIMFFAFFYGCVRLPPHTEATKRKVKTWNDWDALMTLAKEFGWSKGDNPRSLKENFGKMKGPSRIGLGSESIGLRQHVDFHMLIFCPVVMDSESDFENCNTWNELLVILGHPERSVRSRGARTEERRTSRLACDLVTSENSRRAPERRRSKKRVICKVSGLWDSRKKTDVRG